MKIHWLGQTEGGAAVKHFDTVQLGGIKAQLDLELTEAANEHIAREGYDPVYGARPLKRFLQRHVETLLSPAWAKGPGRRHTQT